MRDFNAVPPLKMPGAHFAQSAVHERPDDKGAVLLPPRGLGTRATGLSARRSLHLRPILSVAEQEHDGVGVSPEPIRSAPSSWDSVLGAAVSSSCSASTSPSPRRTWHGRRDFHQQYALGEMLGAGTVSVVRKATRKVDGRTVAVKHVRSDDDEIRFFTRQEFQLMQSLRHPSVARVEAMFDAECSQWIVMELCDVSLDHYIKSNGPIAEDRARGLCLQMFQGVHFLHHKRVVHRDLKPANLLLADDAQCLKITDFNSAKRVGGDSGGSQMLTDRGTREFAAPELRFGRMWNERIDVWSSGLSIYVMLRGVLPFNIMNSDAAKELCEGRLPEIKWTSVSSLFRNLILQCLIVDMCDRPPAMQILLHPALAAADEGDAHLWPSYGTCSSSPCSDGMSDEETENAHSPVRLHSTSICQRITRKSLSKSPKSSVSPRRPLDLPESDEEATDSRCWTERLLGAEKLQDVAWSQCERVERQNSDAQHPDFLWSMRRHNTLPPPRRQRTMDVLKAALIRRGQDGLSPAAASDGCTDGLATAAGFRLDSSPEPDSDGASVDLHGDDGEASPYRVCQASVVEGKKEVAQPCEGGSNKTLFMVVGRTSSRRRYTQDAESADVCVGLPLRRSTPLKRSTTV